MDSDLKTTYYPGFLSNQKLHLHLAAIAMLLSVPGLFIGFQMDDLGHRMRLLGYIPNFQNLTEAIFGLFAFLPGDPFFTKMAMNYGLPWWTFEELKIMFFRPLTSLFMWADYQLWPNVPFMMRLQNLLWYGGIVAIATRFYRNIFGIGKLAGLAAVLYAIKYQKLVKQSI